MHICLAGVDPGPNLGVGSIDVHLGRAQQGGPRHKGTQNFQIEKIPHWQCTLPKADILCFTFWMIKALTQVNDIVMFTVSAGKGVDSIKVIEWGGTSASPTATGFRLLDTTLICDHKFIYSHVTLFRKNIFYCDVFICVETLSILSC